MSCWIRILAFWNDRIVDLFSNSSGGVADDKLEHPFLGDYIVFDSTGSPGEPDTPVELIAFNQPGNQGFIDVLILI
jgi:hypothetical protein